MFFMQGMEFLDLQFTIYYYIIFVYLVKLLKLLKKSAIVTGLKDRY